MIDIKDYLLESIVNEEEKSIKNEDDFKKAVRAKFKKVFGDKLDEDKMNSVIDGVLKKYKKDADDGNWGKLIGIVHKSF